jgi:hypothetical protein
LNALFKSIVLYSGLMIILMGRQMNTDRERIRRELDRAGYSEQAILEILKWYPSRQLKRAKNVKHKEG